MKERPKYDIALSFAGEDRAFVEEVAMALKKASISVFYDKFEDQDLWGKDLYQSLSDIYMRQARYTVIFISQHYAKKAWTNHELKSAQAKAFSSLREYILPIRFDDTSISGVLPTTGYLNAKRMNPVQVAQKIINKLKSIVPDAIDKSGKEEASSDVPKTIRISITGSRIKLKINSSNRPNLTPKLSFTGSAIKTEVFVSVEQLIELTINGSSCRVNIDRAFGGNVNVLNTGPSNEVNYV
jgi:hypothetical protein